MDVYFATDRLADLIKNDRKLIRKFGDENARLILEPAHDPIPRKSDGGIDLNAVTAVTVLDVEDYHD